MTLQALRCSSCGGAIAFPEGKSNPHCLFCGSTAQVQITISNTIPTPKQIFGFAISKEDADQEFRKFTTTSFWYPKDIRQAKLELRQVLLPAWVFQGEIESHYAGLVHASSPSKKRPVSGRDRTFLEHVLVPSSKAISITEINTIAPFDTEQATPFDEASLLYPYELGELTARMANIQCKKAMQLVHKNRISQTHSFSSVQLSSVCYDVQGEPALLPIFIGVYRRSETDTKFYRIVINGISGKLIGEAPFDWVKLISIIAVVSLVIVLILVLQNAS